MFGRQKNSMMKHQLHMQQQLAALENRCDHLESLLRASRDTHQLRIEQLEAQAENLLAIAEMQKEVLHNIGSQVQSISRTASSAVDALTTVSRTLGVASGSVKIRPDSATGE